MLRLMYFATLASRWVYISKRTRLTLLVPEMDKRFILRLGYPVFYSSQCMHQVHKAELFVANDFFESKIKGQRFFFQF
ncbi:hypothetical protein Hanom_Chr06g00517641 [Helianthus anomalus]